MDRAGGGGSGFTISITRGAGGGLLVQAHSVVIAAAISAHFNRLGTEFLQFAEGFFKAGGQLLVRLAGRCLAIQKQPRVFCGDLFEALKLGIALHNGIGGTLRSSGLLTGLEADISDDHDGAEEEDGHRDSREKPLQNGHGGPFLLEAISSRTRARDFSLTGSRNQRGSTCLSAYLKPLVSHQLA